MQHTSPLAKGRKRGDYLYRTDVYIGLLLIMHKGSIYRVLSGSVAYLFSLKRGDGERIIYTRIGLFVKL